MWRDVGRNPAGECCCWGWIGAVLGGIRRLEADVAYVAACWYGFSDITCTASTL